MDTSLALRSLGAGAVTGMRSSLGPAVAARETAIGRYLPLFVLGELIVDKLPIVPPRTLPVALIIRALGGGFAGGSLAKAGGGSGAFGAALGVAGAIGMSYAGVAYRAAAARVAPPFVGALLEDAVAVGLARFIATRS